MAVVDGGSGSAEMVECLGDVGGVPGDDGVGDQGETLALDVLVVGLMSPDLALVGEEDQTSEAWSDSPLLSCP